MLAKKADAVKAAYEEAKADLQQLQSDYETKASYHLFTFRNISHLI